jgi:activator of 2-hydroxyglutaryl-CoA dehydratase
MDLYLGVDIGSVTAKFALTDKSGELVSSVYLRTSGKPIPAIQQGLRQIRKDCLTMVLFKASVLPGVHGTWLES